MFGSLQESDNEYDIHEVAWKNGVIKRQWAETTIVKVRLIDPNTYFGKGVALRVLKRL